MLIVIAVIALLLVSLYVSAHYNWWRPRVDTSCPRVLMYHSINESAEGISPDLVVHPETFEKQLQYLKQQGYQFRTITELLDTQPDGKNVVLTFDDGFRDNYTQMFPLLKKYQAKATIYLAPEIDGIERLDQSRIHEMRDSGLIEFGAHTMHHINLDKAEPEIAAEEISQSKAVVEALTGETCHAFAYPFGRYNDSNVEQVQQVGMRSAVTVKKGIEQVSDPFRIKRISVLGSTNALQFHLAITRGRYRV